MKKYIPVLSKTKLFCGIAASEIEAMLSCLSARQIHCRKGQYVLRQGEQAQYFYILAEGSLYIQKDDYWGNCSILGQICAGELFGEAYGAPDSGPLLNDVVAMEDSVIIAFSVQRILTTCSSACEFHTIVIRNLFYAISERNRRLVQKLDYLAQRSTREKLLAYLSDEAERAGSASFSIPFNRQQLADFLAVDRSAMSSELSRLRKDGLLEFHKNHFCLKQQ